MNQLPETNTVVLGIHADKLLWTRDNGMHTAMLGFNTVSSWFNHTPPNSLDIEYAIGLIEDGLLLLRAEIFGLDTWLCHDKSLKTICQKLNAGNQLEREQVEVYWQQVAHSLNQPALFKNHQLTQSEIAYLLILRETMCHLDMMHVRFVG